MGNSSSVKSKLNPVELKNMRIVLLVINDLQIAKLPITIIKLKAACLVTLMATLNSNLQPSVVTSKVPAVMRQASPSARSAGSTTGSSSWAGEPRATSTGRMSSTFLSSVSTLSVTGSSTLSLLTIQMSRISTSFSSRWESPAMNAPYLALLMYSGLCESSISLQTYQVRPKNTQYVILRKFLRLNQVI